MHCIWIAQEKKPTLYLYNKLKSQAWTDVFKEFSWERGIPGTLVAMLPVGVEKEVIKALFQKMDNFHFESLSCPFSLVFWAHTKKAPVTWSVTG